MNLFLQSDISEDDIDDSFKSMFAQLAGEVGFLNPCSAKHFTSVFYTNMQPSLFVIRTWRFLFMS